MRPPRAAATWGLLVSTAAFASPWDAVDRLGRPGLAAAPGLRVDVAAASSESLPGELETSLGIAWRRRFGAGVAWRRFWMEEEAADGAEAGALLAGERYRIALGPGLLRLGSERAAWLSGRALVALAPSLAAGAAGRWHAGTGNRAPEVRFEVYAAQGAWMGALEAGPRQGQLRLALALLVRPGLVWSAAYTGSSPVWGLAWRAGPAELRGEVEAHALLGSVVRARLVWGGLPR